MFSQNVKESLPFSSTNTAHDATSYKDHLQKHLAEMYDIFEANLVEAGTRQKVGYDTTAKQRPTFSVGDNVWLSKNRSSKLEEGGWTVKTMFRNTSVVEIKTIDSRIRVVHNEQITIKQNATKIQFRRIATYA